jgi:hypothetical protein
MKKDKFYSIFRGEQKLMKGETAAIKDLTSTEFQLVDSVSKLYRLLKELRQC